LDHPHPGVNAKAGSDSAVHAALLPTTCAPCPAGSGLLLRPGNGQDTPVPRPLCRKRNGVGPVDVPGPIGRFNGADTSVGASISCVQQAAKYPSL